MLSTGADTELDAGLVLYLLAQSVVESIAIEECDTEREAGQSAAEPIAFETDVTDTSESGSTEREAGQSVAESVAFETDGIGADSVLDNVREEGQALYDLARSAFESDSGPDTVWDAGRALYNLARSAFEPDSGSDDDDPVQSNHELESGTEYDADESSCGSTSNYGSD